MKTNETIVPIFSFLRRNGTLLFLSFIFCFVLFSCKTADINTPIDPRLKAAFNWQEGTYWVYKDSISGETDSFAVYSNYFSSKVFQGAAPNVYADVIYIDVKEYNIDSNNVINNGDWKWQYKGDASFLSINLNANGIFGGGRSYSNLFIYPIGSKWGDPSSDVPYTSQIFPTYTLNGKNFVNVAEIYCRDSYSNTTFDWFYVNTDIGLVKMRLFDTISSYQHKHILELQRWNIVK